MQSIIQHLEHALSEIEATSPHYDDLGNNLALAEHYTSQAFTFIDHINNDNDYVQNTQNYLIAHHREKASEIEQTASLLQKQLESLTEIIKNDKNTRWQDQETSIRYLQGLIHDLTPILSVTYPELEDYP